MFRSVVDIALVHSVKLPVTGGLLIHTPRSRHPCIAGLCNGASILPSISGLAVQPAGRVFLFLRRLSLLCGLSSVYIVTICIQQDNGNIIPIMPSQSLVSLFSYPALNETKRFGLLKPEIKIDFGLMHESSDTRSVESPIGAQSVIDVCSQSIQLLTLLVIS